MAYDSLADLIFMQGHGVYVWGAYGMGVGVIVYNLVVPRLEFKNIAQRVRRQAEREDSQ